MTGGCAAALLGVSPVETPLALYARLSTGDDQAAKPRALGRALECGLVNLVLAELHRQALDERRAPVENVRLTSSAPLWAFPDALTTAGEVVLVRVAPWTTAADWTDGPPPWLTAAAQWEMAVVGAGRCAVGVYGAGGLWRAGWIGADPEAAGRLVAAAEDFTRRLAESDPPAPRPDGELGAVKAVFDHDDEGEVRLSRDHARQWDTLRELRRRRNHLGKRAAALETRLRYAVALHRFGLLPDGRRLKLAVDAGGGRRLVEVEGKR